MTQLLLDLVFDDRGGALLEYGLIAALLAAPCLAALSAIAALCGTTLSNSGTGLTSIGQTNP